ncbi:MAG: outer membrane protein precursor [Pseudomonadota bacterium]|jgi:OOP family OmpA-OmpF porin
MTHTRYTAIKPAHNKLVGTLKVISHHGLKGSLLAACAALMWTFAQPSQAQQLQQPEGTRTASRAGLTGQIEDLADPFVQASVWVERSQGRLVFYRPRQAGLGTTASQPDSLQNVNHSGIRNVTRPLEVGARRVQNAVQEAAPAATDTSVDFETDARQPGAASVFVNGDYQASLVPGGYSQVCIRPGPVRLGVRYADIGKRVANTARMDSISELGLNGGGTQYIKVQEGQGGRAMTLIPVGQQQALTELAGTRLQMHTVSRVKGQMACQMVQKPATESLTLAGDTLFKFDRSDRAGLTDQGVQALELLVQNIRNTYQLVEHVHLIGYTDPLGSDAYNQRLARERAATVSDYLQMSPLLRGRITTEGRGATELVVNNCGSTPTPQTQACNQPNRRVVVQVTGVRN